MIGGPPSERVTRNVGIVPLLVLSPSLWFLSGVDLTAAFVVYVIWNVALLSWLFVALGQRHGWKSPAPWLPAATFGFALAQYQRIWEPDWPLDSYAIDEIVYGLWLLLWAAYLWPRRLLPARLVLEAAALSFALAAVVSTFVEEGTSNAFALFALPMMLFITATVFSTIRSGWQPVWFTSALVIGFYLEATAGSAVEIRAVLALSPAACGLAFTPLVVPQHQRGKVSAWLIRAEHRLLRFTVPVVVVVPAALLLAPTLLPSSSTPPYARGLAVVVFCSGVVAVGVAAYDRQRAEVAWAAITDSLASSRSFVQASEIVANQAADLVVGEAWLITKTDSGYEALTHAESAAPLTTSLRSTPPAWNAPGVSHVARAALEELINPQRAITDGGVTALNCGQNRWLVVSTRRPITSDRMEALQRLAAVGGAQIHTLAPDRSGDLPYLARGDFLAQVDPLDGTVQWIPGRDAARPPGLRVGARITDVLDLGSDWDQIGGDAADEVAAGPSTATLRMLRTGVDGWRITLLKASATELLVSGHRSVADVAEIELTGTGVIVTRTSGELCQDLDITEGMALPDLWDALEIGPLMQGVGNCETVRLALAHPKGRLQVDMLRGHDGQTITVRR